MPNKIDLSGRRFGKLVALEPAGSDGKQALWMCQCDCGNTKTAKRDNLQRGRTKSCGCLGLIQRQQAAQVQSHDCSRRNNPKEHRAWDSMLRRCYSSTHPSHDLYSKNSIGVCESWRKSFINFLTDMGKCPPGYTLERIKNDENYHPGNCKWASRKEQASNRTTNVWIEHEGQTKTIRQWEETFGWRKGTLNSRLNLGWTIERALTTPVKERKHKH